MVKLTFTSVAVEGYQGFAGEQELSFGNAFAGAADKAAYDREMFNALHAASFLGDEATIPSNIANAQLRMTAAYNEVGSNKKGGSEKGISLEQLMMLENVRSLLNDLGRIIYEAKENQEDLENAYKAFMNGEFDPLNNEEHRELIERNGMSAEEWSLLSLQAQEQWFQEKIQQNADLIRRAEANYNYLEENPQALDTDENGIPTDPNMRNLVELAREAGSEIDVENLTPESRQSLLATMFVNDIELKNNQIELEDNDIAGRNTGAMQAKVDSFF